MRFLIVFILFFPVMAISQQRFDIIRDSLMQNKKYEYVGYLENHYAVFRTFDHKAGLMDSTGVVILEAKYSYITTVRKLRNLVEVGERINNKFKRGYIDLKGNVRIPIIYDDVYYIGKGIIRVNKDNTYGVLDTLNTTVIPVEYDYVSFDKDLIVAGNDGIKNLYDREGKRISTLQFAEITRFTNNKAIVVFKNKSSAIIDTLGSIVLDPIEGYRFERVLDGDLYVIKNEFNSKVGIVNGQGEFVIGCIYDEIRQEKSCFIAKDIDKYGFISKDYSVIIPFVYDRVYKSYFGERNLLEGVGIGESFIVVRDKLWGVLIPTMESPIIPIVYKRIETLFDRYFIVKDTNDQNGLFLKNGEKILNEEYVFYNVFGRTIFASKADKQYLITLENDQFREAEVVADAFLKIEDDYEYPRKAYQIFTLNGKYGVINYENNIVIPCTYDLIGSIYFSNEFIAGIGKKYGVINARNEIVVEIEYDAYKKEHEGIRFTKANQKITKYHDIEFDTDEEPPPLSEED